MVIKWTFNFRLRRNSASTDIPNLWPCDGACGMDTKSHQVGAPWIKSDQTTTNGSYIPGTDVWGDMGKHEASW